MKKNKIVSGLLVVLLVMLSFGTLAFAAGHEDIVEIALETDDLSTLVAALQEAELVTALQDPEGPFTVFAPTNAAFQDLLDALEIEVADLLAHPQLADVLLFHVVEGEFKAEDLGDMTSVTTLQGEEWEVDLSIVETADIEASNGVIHIIDEVLVPEAFVLEQEEEDEEESNTIVDIAVGNDDFSTLVAALQKAELVEALQGEGPFTVFAPTNDAFAKLLDALDITAEQLLDHPQLADVLLYHVVTGAAVTSDQLTDGQEVETMQGEMLVVDLSDGVLINESAVIDADIEADNGVIHVIDTVLVPEAFVLSAEEDIPEGGDIGMLPYIFVGALGVSGLVVMKKKK